MPVNILKHPLVRHKLGLLRQARLSTRDFRELTYEITQFLMIEATRDLPVERRLAEGWAGTVQVGFIQGKILTLVPILRAGIGMLESARVLVPGAKVSVIGTYRDEATLEPRPYYEKLALDMASRRAIILDPMLATGGSLCDAIRRLKAAGCVHIRSICLVAAPEGLSRVEAEHPDVEVITAALDRCLNENGYILPGLGDAGDRLFGTK